MKIYRVRQGRRTFHGVLEEDKLRPVRGGIFGRLVVEDRAVPIADVRVLAPVIPTKIVCIGTNYKDHALEMGKPLPKEPLLFLKPPSAVIAPGEPIIPPAMSARVDYEGELAVIVKRAARALRDDDDPADYILGYACFNDVTARDLQALDGQFTRAKGFDTFAPLGPCIATGLDASALRVKTFLNGKIKQNGSTSNLVFSVPELVRFISRVMTLQPGDVIATGTPSGVGPVTEGDRVDVQIEGIGTLSNPVGRTAPATRGATLSEDA